MRLTIDTDAKILTVDEAGERRDVDLYGQEAFDLLALQWLKTSWNRKYSYTFSWMGRPIIQHPDDMARVQEVIYALKPDVIIETGVAHGGSLVFSASILKLIGKGRVVGVDIEIRPHNRKAIEAHELAPMITLIEGDSVAPQVVAQATAGIGPDDTVLVFLDSNHSYAHVLAELEAYHHIVTPGSYIVATDGLMRDLWDVPRGDPSWRHDNPAAAAEAFAARHPDFVIETPPWPFNESPLDQPVTAWPNAWLKRLR
ncbi:cephalosporin hydroxylase family protein [Azospirillum halopraeferens]|uniref:cephalosporin hydroxylase family protein n=1 Tax=Azospirillum halopraeferens TaxID=34010 RepID=UPI0004223FA5|nr:CmcI family methyltransferase [Azospirillum halopraeferens]